MTGKKKKLLRPEHEHISSIKPELCIIDQETWDLAQKRWEEVEGVWPMIKHYGGSEIRTHGTLVTYTRFPSVLLKPLGHPSKTAELKSVSWIER